MSIPSLHEFDYLELCTIDHPDKFHHDFELYLGFLSSPKSSRMGCCASVDNAVTPYRLLSTESRIIPCTYLYVPGELTRDSVMSAWNERCAYAVYGNLCLDRMAPIPSKEVIEGADATPITLTVTHRRGKKITTAEIYRNGRRAYQDRRSNKDVYSLSWQDEHAPAGRNHYIVHIEAEGEHLVTSPVNYALE